MHQSNDLDSTDMLLFPFTPSNSGILFFGSPLI